MATFYPINTPLINYFFYKSAFISNSFVLSNFTILSAGSGYQLNDVIVTSGGTYTNPAVLQVTSIGVSGSIASAAITNSGKYTVSPTTLGQAYTNGSGTGATFTGLSFAPNLLPPGPNIPLSGGFIYFYADEDHTIQLPTYSDVFDPNNPVVNTDPIQLGAAGDCPLFYLDDRLYYIVITDYTGDQQNPIATINHYNPADGSSSITGTFNQNYIANPQFNYPIEFWKTTDGEGEISEAQTTVAWSWNFYEDEDTDSDNNITFENVVGQGIEGSPIFQVVLNSETVSSSETLKDFGQIIGTVDFMAGQTVTFSSQMISITGSSINVELLLYLNYGIDGSDSRFVPITTFSINGNRKKVIYSFTIPDITGYSIGDDSFMELRIRVGLGQICQFGMTNVLLEPGNVSTPLFLDEAKAFSKAMILGDSTEIENAGLYQNYSSYYYSNGKIFPYYDTGTIVLAPTNLIQNFRAVCDGSSRSVNGYTTNNIPNRRLFDAIGTQFGGSGDLIITAKDNVVTFESPIGARQKSDYTAGTTSFTVSNTIIGLRFDIDLTFNNTTTVSGNFVDNFAPSQTNPTFPTVAGHQYFIPSSSGVLTYWGTFANIIPNTNIVINTLTPGSISAQATFEIVFNSSNPADYSTRFVPVTISGNTEIVGASFIEFASFSNNNRQPAGSTSINNGIGFTIDGIPAANIGIKDNYVITVEGEDIDVPFLSNISILANIKNFVKQVANPFQWTITVTSAPAASQYFLYSSKTVDYYAWFSVDGVGTDPAIVGRTGTEIPTFSGQSEEQIAAVIADTLNNATFSVPAPGDLPALVVDSKVSWFINL